MACNAASLLTTGVRTHYLWAINVALSVHSQGELGIEATLLAGVLPGLWG